jgi:beta-mannosidase
MSAYHPLNQGWTLTAAEGADVPSAAASPVPATVPGCVHLDLLAAGLIEDPYLDDNEARCAWIGRAGWVYETAFDWAPDGADRVDLACAGLDTVATVTVNDVEVGRTANMHRSYRFDVTDVLRPGANTLAVHFDSAYAYAEALRERLGDRPNAYPEPFQFIRKMACNFGWDWGPTLVTAGIWQPIGLHSWRTARLAEVRPLATVEGRDGMVEVRFTLARSQPAPLTVVVTVAGERVSVPVAPGDDSGVVRLTVPEPDLWWPRGYGGQPRYDVDVSLYGPDSRLLDTWSHKIGFRSVRLDTTPDTEGSAFTLVVNDVPVFVRGANWIPDDAFPSRVTRDRYAARLAQACEANVNLLRVWGGGRYESFDFYDLADAYGLLVAQDFLFACAAYPEEEPLASEVAAEAREQVARLSGHPSLVLWTGNNENIWGWHDWGWQEALAGRSWGLGYYLEVLPRIVADTDPTRPYWPGSPYSGSPDRHPNDPAHGTTHIWDVWNTHDYTHYRAYRPRFVAEFGFQGPPAYATLRRAVSDEPLAADSPGVAHHQKAGDGNAKLLRGLAPHLPEPATFDDWHFATQLNQARAISLGIEYFRSLRPRCTGTIVWQLNDCWPVISWAAVDGDGRRKPLWYALRRAYADRLLTVQPHEDGLALVAVNDSASVWSAAVPVRRATLAGEVVADTTVDVAVPPGGAVSVPLPGTLCQPHRPTGEFLLAEAGAVRAWWFFAEDRNMAYPPPAYDASVTPVDDGYLVTVTARVLLRDVTLFPDRLDPAATVDDALVTLLPGERFTFRVRSRAALAPDALTRAPVLRCVNDLTAR